MKQILRTLIILLPVFLLGLGACNTTEPPVSEEPDDCTLEAISASSEVRGYGIFAKLPGIWNGPVSSPTPLGSFPEWIVDFRPISPSQISAKNELDRLNDIFMSFFIVKHDCEYKVAFRNGGGFAGAVRNSYMVIDSVSEEAAQSFYRFSDPIAGGQRVYTDVTFRGDSIIMHAYTNIFNSLEEPTTHMIWTAELRDLSSSEEAISHFGFPQKTLVKDFTSTFDSLTEAVFYSALDDPYPEEAQPYQGESTVNISISNPTSPNTARKILVIVTTQPLFGGGIFNPSQLDFRSRYVLLDAANSTSFTFNYMHPGSYFVNAIYDHNGDLDFSSGDYINLPFDVPMTLEAESTTSAAVNISFEIL